MPSGDVCGVLQRGLDTGHVWTCVWQDWARLGRAWLDGGLSHRLGEGIQVPRAYKIHVRALSGTNTERKRFKQLCRCTKSEQKGSLYETVKWFSIYRSTLSIVFGLLWRWKFSNSGTEQMQNISERNAQCVIWLVYMFTSTCGWESLKTAKQQKIGFTVKLWKKFNDQREVL